MLALISVVSVIVSTADTPTIDANRELFLDDVLIASMSNVTRHIHQADKFPGNPVLRATEPWEGKIVIVYGSILFDNGRYRAWYHCDGGVGYAESDDGVTWRKPTLDAVSIAGKATNLVIDRTAKTDQPGFLPYYYELFGVLKDDREPDPARRYKMGYLSLQTNPPGPRQDPLHQGQRRGLGVAGSPDGVHWSLIDSWATEAISDGATHWMLDPARRKFVLYGRTQYVAPEVKQRWKDDEWVKKYFWGRSSARVESSDFVQWDFKDPLTAPVVMTADLDDPPGTEIYGMGAFPYGAGYIGLVQMFHNRPEDTRLEIQLAYSRDSIHYVRVGDRTPFIPCGPVGSWDRFNNSLATNPPIEVGDELRIYYAGRTYRHSPYSGADKGVTGGYIGFATIKRDRFVSLDASFDGGEIVTVPLRLSTPTVHMNAKADFGRIVVTVLDESGATIATSKPVERDELDIRLEWESGQPPKPNSPVTLHISLQNAQLYAIWSLP